ncbi:MAG: hypothetical protein ABIR26_10280 [Ramlibacter sp.]
MRKFSSTFLFVFAALALVYASWLITFWPGILGQDSLALLNQIEGSVFQSGKPVMWHLFVQLLYEPDRRIEVPIVVQLLLCALIFARILAWLWCERMTKSFMFVLFFIALAPQVVYYQTALYADGLFSAAVAGLTFEAWRIVRDKHVSALSLAYLSFLLPCALFLRPNGIFMAVMLVPLLLAVPKAGKLKILAVFAVWTVLYQIADNAHPSLQRHGALFPLAAFETVNFLQPDTMGLRPPSEHVTGTAIALLETRQPISEILKYYDRDYWDPLVYRFGGPAFLDFSETQKDLLVTEFFCCNLWSNFPAFMASRVNIFLVSALGHGGFGGPDETLNIMPLIKSTSAVRPFDTGFVESFLRSMIHLSYIHRWLAWTPFLGIGLLVVVMWRTWHRRDWLTFLVVAPLGLQLAGVFVFSIAGEYRYLLFIFTSTAALLPIYAATRTSPGTPATAVA